MTTSILAIIGTVLTATGVFISILGKYKVAMYPYAFAAIVWTVVAALNIGDGSYTLATMQIYNASLSGILAVIMNDIRR